MSTTTIVEASIDDLQSALTSGAITSVDLVARYLRRISKYDCRGLALNAIPVLNNAVFEEAAASDDRRADGAPVRPLEGIPYTVKDSYKVRGMTVASGSPAFQNLIANEDAFTVDMIRKAGGVLIGRTNMPPMAWGGMQRGIYGRAENPYNPEWLAAGWASGSSNGSAVATAASFAAFGMGEETVSSGRSPASNNALIAYTPSRGYLSIRGNWPLYPTCDVIVPHTRTVKDLLALLDVISAEDDITEGDFWRNQPFVQLPKPWTGKPSSFQVLGQSKSLTGLRVAVPEMYIGGPSPTGAPAVYTNPEVVGLWEQARKDLESLGAEVVIIPDFPLVTAYENPDLLPLNSPRLPTDWQSSERGPLVAHAWNDFLQQNKDPNMPDLASCDPLSIFPDSVRTAVESKYVDPANAIHWTKLVEYTKSKPLYSTENLGVAVAALEGMRKTLLEDWLVSRGCQCVVFPAAGDVGAADADINDQSAEHAWRNGVHYSNGNRALRHLGVPTVSVPMGIIRSKQVPVNLTFAGRAYDDINLLKWANAYESKTQRRVAPFCTPELKSDIIESIQPGSFRKRRPLLDISDCKAEADDDGEHAPRMKVSITGTVTVPELTKPMPLGSSPIVEIVVDGVDVPQDQIEVNKVPTDTASRDCFSYQAWISVAKPAEPDARSRTQALVARDKTLVVVIARSAPGGYPSGCIRLV